MQYCKYIIKGYASKAMIRPFYTMAFDYKNMTDKVGYMKKMGDCGIRVVEYKNRDRQVEGAIKRCSVGSERENANLQYLFNLNVENEVNICAE